MRGHLDNIPADKFPRLYREMHRQARNDALIFWAGRAAAVLAIFVAVLLIGGAA